VSAFDRRGWREAPLFIVATACLVVLGVAPRDAQARNLRVEAQIRSSSPASGGPVKKPAVGPPLTTPSPPVIAIPFGAPGDLPVVGRWTGSPTTYIGLYRPRTSTFYLRTHNAAGPPDSVIAFGMPGDVPVVGRWCRGARSDALGVYRPKIRSLIFRCVNEISTVPFGGPGDIPVAGDWWGTSYSSIGVYRPGKNTFLLSRGPSVGMTIPFGAAGDIPVIRHLPTGSLVGVYRPKAAAFLLSDSPASPSSVITIPFGATHDIPLIGDWTGDGTSKVGVYRPRENTFHLKMTFP